MKKIKHLLPVLFQLLFISVSGQTYYYAESLQVIPSGPTTADTVKVKVDGNFASTGSYITGCYVSVTAFQVDLVINCDDIGGFAVLVPFDTTLTIGVLPAGNYTINLSGTSLGDFVPLNQKSFTVYGSTGMDEIFNNAHVSVYPNPFSSQTTISISNIFDNASLHIYNSAGQNVHQAENISGQIIILQRNWLPGGLYVLRLTQDNKLIYTTRLLIIDN